MRILILTASLPYPPASGGAIRSYGLLKGLHQSGHQITLLSFHDASTPIQATPLSQYCKQIETVSPPHRTKTNRLRDLILSSQPDIAQRLYSPAMGQRLEDVMKAEDFDLIQFEGIEVACYLPLVRQMKPRAKLCFDTFNAEYALQRVIYEVDRQDIKRWHMAAYSLIQSGRIARFERDVCQQADSVIAVSPEDAEALRGFRSDGQISVVPNGIFADDYSTPDEKITLGENVIVFTGKMDYRPNVDAMLWFTSRIFPEIRRHIPGTHLVIVGQKPHARIEALRETSGVTVTGWVQAVQPYLHAASVYVAPLRMGSGTRLKILEAMASGCAVVATSAGAAGLLDEVTQGLLIADDEMHIANAIIKLLQNPDQRRDLGKSARQLVKQYYDWSVIIPRLLAAYKDMGFG